MKKIWIPLILLLLVTLTMPGIQAQNTETVDQQKIRVGLKSLYETVDKIEIHNTSVILGYEVNGQWQPEKELIDSTGFYVIPTTGYYLVSSTTFGSYESSQMQVDVLVQQGLSASAGSVSPGIWKVYIGSFSTVEEANSALSGISGDITWEVTADNGLRTLIVAKQTGQKLVMENATYTAQFSTNDNVNQVAVINLGSRSYRGKMEIGRYKKAGVTAINVLPINQYLYSVVPSEIPSSWPIESIKAQTIAARNYAVYYTSIGSKYPNEAYDVCDTVSSQVYKGYTNESLAAIQAVNETAGKLIYYQDKIILANYFSTSGGHTEDSQNVWSGTVAYLTGVPDIYETEPEAKPWVITLKSSDIEATLAKNGVNIGTVLDVQVTSYTEAGRAMTLKIVGSSGNYELTKETMRTFLGLPSRKFTLVKEGYTPVKDFYAIQGISTVSTINIDTAYIQSSTGSPQQISSSLKQINIVSADNIASIPTMAGEAGTYIFVGMGSGHGVGMSQSGAKGMAKAGFTYDEILEYYFTGTEVK